MSSPTELVGIPKAGEENARIEKEDQFLVRLPASIVCPHDELNGNRNRDGRRATIEYEQPEKWAVTFDESLAARISDTCPGSP